MNILNIPSCRRRYFFLKFRLTRPDGPPIWGLSGIGSGSNTSVQREGTMRTFLLVTVAVVTAAVASAEAQATVLISNFPQTNDNFGSSIASTPNQSKAAGFTTPTGDAYVLDSVTMRLLVQNTARTIDVYLYGGSATNPSGSALTSFVVPAFTALGTSDYTFQASSAFTLAAGSTYWIVASANGTGGVDDINWKSSVPGINPTGLATSAGYTFSASNTIPPTSSSSVFNTYSVQGTLVNTPIPEPTSLAVLGMGIAIGAAVRRRRAGRD
jgi:PEP-CTERM motif